MNLRSLFRFFHFLSRKFNFFPKAMYRLYRKGSITLKLATQLGSLEFAEIKSNRNDIQSSVSFNFIVNSLSVIVLETLDYKSWAGSVLLEVVLKSKQAKVTFASRFLR